MTETTANIEVCEEINPVAFLAALVLAPLLCTAPFALLAWLHGALNLPSGGLMLVAIIPVVALVLGVIPYLLFGTPAFVVALRQRGSPVGAALIANFIAAPAVLVVFGLLGDFGDAIGMTVFMLVFGCLFAPLWGSVFGALYRLFSKA